MKIAIYSPYLDTAGGGEKYMLAIAQVLSVEHQVDVLIDEHLSSIGVEEIKNKILKLHNLNLDRIRFLKAPIGIGSSFIKRSLFLRQYDYLISNTDGSIFFATAKHNIIHFQVPFQNKYKQSLKAIMENGFSLTAFKNNLWGRIKVSTWEKAIINSKFTKEVISKEWSIKGEVIYPPIDIEHFKSRQKKKQIISVGRFFGFLKDKKQDLMIDVFKQLVNEGKLKGWSLYLVGVASDGDMKFVDELREAAKGFDIQIHPNLSFDNLVDLYSTSAIYWHALGFNEDDPKKQEHFGMTTVEAMASGSVPIVINKGGQKEIVEEGINGFLWDSVEELKDKSVKVALDNKLQNKLKIEAVKKSKQFSRENFEKQIKGLINA